MRVQLENLGIRKCFLKNVFSKEKIEEGSILLQEQRQHAAVFQFDLSNKTSKPQCFFSEQLNVVANDDPSKENIDFEILKRNITLKIKIEIH